MDVRTRLNVVESGLPNGPTMVLAHGFGCDQSMWSATFFADNRDDLRQVGVPTLVLQCSEDPIAPVEVGRFTHYEIPGSTFHQLKATGHCPNLSAPEETVDAIRSFLGHL